MRRSIFTFQGHFHRKAIMQLAIAERVDYYLQNCILIINLQVYKAIEDKTNFYSPTIKKQWSIGPLTGLSCIFRYDSINIDYFDDSSVWWKGYYPWINFL